MARSDEAFSAPIFPRSDSIPAIGRSRSKSAMGPSTDLTAGKSDFRSSPKADSNIRRPCNACEVLHLEIIGAAAGPGGTSYQNRLDVCRRLPGTEVLAFAKGQTLHMCSFQFGRSPSSIEGAAAAQPALPPGPGSQSRQLQPRRSCRAMGAGPKSPPRMWGVKTGRGIHRGSTKPRSPRAGTSLEIRGDLKASIRATRNLDAVDQRDSAQQAGPLPIVSPSSDWQLSAAMRL